MTTLDMARPSSKAETQRDPRYDILFTPIKLGPVTARNRFFQVPHCNGMGWPMPRAMAKMREIKAEGGWAVISTEECEIHPSSDVLPYPEARLWDDRDIPTLARMCDGIHKYGSLAAVELVHNGPSCANLYSREVPLAPSHQPVSPYHPFQAKGMDKQDIRNYRRWHKEAALRAQAAGFDVVYVYAGHDLSLAQHFLQKRRNQRTDEYGGSLENRVRLLRELIEDTKEAVGHRCAVGVRLAVDELLGENGIVSSDEGKDIVAMLAELPDFWDVNISAWANDSQTSRFADEGYQEKYIAFVKQLTTKPVVGVGRFTSPDTMVSQIRRGILDMIGAARPSIADPFLPKKIEEGRIDDIRECIGCNICVSGDMTCTPIRCTQNPTMAEEWRKGWHPEYIAPRKSDDRVLIIGAGPAGLECARALGQRGYQVQLAEAEGELGGRVKREAKLPGLAQWIRVRDYRVQQLGKMSNVEIYPGSHLSLDDIGDLDAHRIIVATGSHWRKDGVGRAVFAPIPGFDSSKVYSPDQIMAGAMPSGRVIVFDDDHYYMGSVLAEKLVREGCEVTLVTPAEVVSYWTYHTLERGVTQQRLLSLGVKLMPSHVITGFAGDHAQLSCVYTGKVRDLSADAIVTVTSRAPKEKLYHDLLAVQAQDEKLKQVIRIGDCEAPATIAAAIYAGHRAAREFDEVPAGDVPFRREIPGIAYSGD